MKTKRAYKERFYPTPEQETLLTQSFDCARFVYNNTLNFRTEAHQKDGQSVSYSQAVKRLVSLKQAFSFLADVSSVTLQQTLRDQQAAFKNFWAGRAKYPKLKKKYSRQSIRLTKAAFNVNNDRQLKYKTKWADRTVAEIDRFFPSYKRCSGCGFVNESLPLSIREWYCPECNTRHNRDINAAKNIKTAGLAGLACGATGTEVAV